MVISYNWVSQYLPENISPERLSQILTSIGLEVESMHPYTSISGGLEGLVTGYVVSCEKHPDADKLSLTKVDVGSGELLSIVCGANNVKAGQHVIVATAGTTLYPTNGEPFTIKKTRIRGEESNGMICAEDEIGIGLNHDGIIVLPENTPIGKPVKELYDIYTDTVYEIGLTPNRMDAMSHIGVAKDVTAYLAHHHKTSSGIKTVNTPSLQKANDSLKMEIKISGESGCKRYCGISIGNIQVKESPTWLKNKLTAIGQKPINNIVDITNYILHDTGQPLHAFDADKITGKKIDIGFAAADEQFTTLDGKIKKLSPEDLMIKDEQGGMCIAGVYGGVGSGVTEQTTNLFLESAWFDPATIRKTSFRHDLRTEAATRFEKGVDISQSLQVLKRAAALVLELAGGEVASDIYDLYPAPVEKKTIGLKYHYLKKLSGKNYHVESIKTILTSLGFSILKENPDELLVEVPHSKRDISLPADIVEEILRIDGLDNIDIPVSIQMSPSIDPGASKRALREKISDMLTANGFYEIFTNSITHSEYYNADTLDKSVKLINNLSIELDILRPDLLPTTLEVIAHNLNRKNADLKIYEYGQSYSTTEGKYNENKHLILAVTGNAQQGNWSQKAKQADIYYVKGVVNQIASAAGFTKQGWETIDDQLILKIHNQPVGFVYEIESEQLQKFGIKVPVFYADINWTALEGLQSNKGVSFKEIPKYPLVERDLSLVVDKHVPYDKIEESVRKAKVTQLKETHLFDVFVSEKVGIDKKSFAVNFKFQDEQKTLTDVETEEFMQKIIGSIVKNTGAEIRK